jgi:hypothetical protein
MIWNIETLELKPGCFTCPYTAKDFPYSAWNPESRRQALEAVQAHTAAEILRRERLAGRPLSRKELRDGIARADTRTLRQKIADANRKEPTNEE